MRPRTPTLLWIPFVFSIGTISWALLLGGLVLLAAVIITPAMENVREVKITRNDYRATLELLDQKIGMQKEFIAAANKEPPLMERLASRQLNLFRKDEEFLIVDSESLNKDRSVQTLLAESLVPTTPKEEPGIPGVLVKPLPFGLDLLSAKTRSLWLTIACAAMACSFFLGVKFERN